MSRVSPIAAVLIAGAFRLLPATRPPARKPLDVAGIATLSLLLTALVFGLNGLDTTAIAASLLSWPVALAIAATGVSASTASWLLLPGVLGAPLRLVILDNCLPAERGAAQGILSNLTSIGRLLGATFVGSVAASVGGGIAGYQAAFIGTSTSTSTAQWQSSAPSSGAEPPGRQAPTLC